MECKKIDKSKALVRLLNGCDWLESIDIYGDGILIFSDVKFKNFTFYTYVIKGSHKIDIYKAGDKSNPILRTNIEVASAQIYTMAITGEENKPTILVINEDINEQPSLESAIGRTVNLMPNIPPVDLIYNGNVSVVGIEYRDITPYVFLPPGKYEFSVADSKTQYKLSEQELEFKVKRIYTIYLIENNLKVESILSVDGNTYICL